MPSAEGTHSAVAPQRGSLPAGGCRAAPRPSPTAGQRRTVGPAACHSPARVGVFANTNLPELRTKRCLRQTPRAAAPPRCAPPAHRPRSPAPPPRQHAAVLTAEGKEAQGEGPGGTCGAGSPSINQQPGNSAEEPLIATGWAECSTSVTRRMGVVFPVRPAPVDLRVSGCGVEAPLGRIQNEAAESSELSDGAQLHWIEAAVCLQRAQHVGAAQSLGMKLV